MTIMPRTDVMVTVLRDPALAAAAIAAAEDPLFEGDGCEDTVAVEEAAITAEEDAVVVVLVVGLGFSAVGSV